MNELIQYQEMREAIQRVRELHKGKLRYKLDRDTLVCSECSGFNKFNEPVIDVIYPCQTIKALDGESCLTSI